jgi:hypothetical protein
MHRPSEFTSNPFHPFTAKHGLFYSGVYCALLFLHAILASLATKVIAKLQYPYVLLNIAYVHIQETGFPWD